MASLSFIRTNKWLQNKEQGLNAQIAAHRNRLQVVQHKLHECFHEDGGIKPLGLKLEMAELDEKRRKETNPLDGNQQSLIQGQQNEVQKLMDMRDKLDQEAKNLQETISGLELEINEVKNSIERRNRNA